jgi:hypothetical protein
VLRQPIAEEESSEDEGSEEASSARINESSSVKSQTTLSASSELRVSMGNASTEGTSADNSSIGSGNGDVDAPDEWIAEEVNRKSVDWEDLAENYAADGYVDAAPVFHGEARDRNNEAIEEAAIDNDRSYAFAQELPTRSAEQQFQDLSILNPRTHSSMSNDRINPGASESRAGGARAFTRRKLAADEALADEVGTPQDVVDESLARHISAELEAEEAAIALVDTQACNKGSNDMLELERRGSVALPGEQLRMNDANMPHHDVSRVTTGVYQQETAEAIAVVEAEVESCKQLRALERRAAAKRVERRERV